jgi:hypothetical protein
MMPALLLFALCIAALLTTVSLRSKQEAFHALPPPTRSQLLEHGLAELRTMCSEPSAGDGPLHDHCIEEARLVLALPECGPPCRIVATAALPHARR